jgi:hypothetical protein
MCGAVGEISGVVAWRERRGRRTLVFVSSSDDEPEVFAAEFAFEEALRPEVARELPIFFTGTFALDTERVPWVGYFEGAVFLEVPNEATLVVSSSSMTLASFRGRPRGRGGAPGGGGSGTARLDTLPSDARSVLFRMREDRRGLDVSSSSSASDSNSDSDSDEETEESDEDGREFVLWFNENSSALERFDNREGTEDSGLLAEA